MDLSSDKIVYNFVTRGLRAAKEIGEKIDKINMNKSRKVKK